MFLNHTIPPDHIANKAFWMALQFLRFSGDAGIPPEQRPPLNINHPHSSMDLTECQYSATGASIGHTCTLVISKNRPDPVDWLSPSPIEPGPRRWAENPKPRSPQPSRQTADKNSMDDPNGLRLI
jgi:hypothetical protein